MRARALKLIALLAIAILIFTGLAPSLMRNHDCPEGNDHCLYCHVIAEGIRRQTILSLALIALALFSIFNALRYARKGVLNALLYTFSPVEYKVRMNN